MTLKQALVLINKNMIPTEGENRTRKRVYLVCGFQPLHLATFLQAYQAERQPQNRAELLTGLYGDLTGNLERAVGSGAIAAAMVIEWADIDGRLGLRANAGWGNSSLKDIAASTPERLKHLAEKIGKLAARMPLALLGPTLGLPPLDSTIEAQAGWFELELGQQVAAFLRDVAEVPGVRLVRPPQTLPDGGGRLDARMELLAGFPYSLPYAAAVAQSLAAVLWQGPPRKGLITDLDGTLWAGIVGEVGAQGVNWSHEYHSHPHGLYQQMLGHLAECGALLGVVSKNELTVVQEALARKDLLLDADALFPVLASWGSKSKAVEEVLRVWNIGADSVVFVDDSPMELGEVGLAFPEMTCIRHPGNDAAGVWKLLGQLRDLFGKPVILEEDRLRRNSIRAGAVIRESGEAANSIEFMRGLQGTVKLDYARSDSGDKRALELINKTNQFNLNGVRVMDGEWQKVLQEPGTLTVVASYEDKFGPLGRIGVLVAEPKADAGAPRLRIKHWVLSCRAFSRRVEHHMLDSLLRRSGAEEIEFAFTATDRNQPVQEFLTQTGATGGGCLLTSRFRDLCGPLPHKTEELPA